jgi:hypothetical protein
MAGQPEHCRGGGEIPHNKPTGEGRSSGTAQQPGAEKLVKVVVGGKLHRRGGEDPLPM